MTELLVGVAAESYELFLRMAPYLLFGFMLAGVLHVFLDTVKISRSLGGATLGNSVKASLYGVPLPLCSCSVIPTAMSLHKGGASRGSTLSFLVSTPATGVDSVLTTYSLLGGVFALYRVVASFVAGVIAGFLGNLTGAGPGGENVTESSCPNCSEDHSDGLVPEHPFLEKVRGAVRYAFGELLSENAVPLVAGIFLGGAIAYIFPEGLIENYLGSGLVPIIVMLLMGLPMYVCANASVPVAAALMLKGLSPGAAFSFLLAGPATNMVTISVVARNMGGRALAAYLSAIVASAISMGLLLDRLFALFDIEAVSVVRHAHGWMPLWASRLSGGVLFVMIVLNLVRSRYRGGAFCKRVR